MPVLLAILAAIGGAIWWYIRSNPREAIGTAQDLTETLINAPRRIKFRRQTNAHPVEGIEDPRIALAAIGQSFIELDGLPTQEQRDQLHLSLRTQLGCDAEEAEEMEVVGRWLMSQCQGAAEAIPRLARRLKKLDDGRAWDELQTLLQALVGETMTSKQEAAIEDLRLAFRK